MYQFWVRKRAVTRGHGGGHSRRRIPALRAVGRDYGCLAIACAAAARGVPVAQYFRRWSLALKNSSEDLVFADWSAPSAIPLPAR